MVPVWKAKLGQRKEITFNRHATTFYRKLKVLKTNDVRSTVQQYFGVVKSLPSITQNKSNDIKAFPPLTDQDVKSRF